MTQLTQTPPLSLNFTFCWILRTHGSSLGRLLSLSLSLRNPFRISAISPLITSPAQKEDAVAERFSAKFWLWLRGYALRNGGIHRFQKVGFLYPVIKISTSEKVEFTLSPNSRIYYRRTRVFSEMASRPTRSRRAPPQQQEQQSRAKWTPSLTKILTDLMVEQVQKGNRPNNSFGKKAWKYICDDFYKKTSLKWEEQLKHRYAVLRKQFATVKSLLDHNDFSWDETTGTIIAKDEAWNKYIKEHPDAETIKSTGCPNYRQLLTIFSELATNGTYDQPAEYEKGTPCPEPLNAIEEESSSESEEVDDIADDQDKFQSITTTTAGGRKRGRKGIDDAIARAILEMASASKLRTAAVKQRNARFTISDCIKELDEMQDIEERMYFAALDLFDNPNAREMFLSLKSDRRLTWLHGKCSAPSSSIG